MEKKGEHNMSFIRTLDEDIPKEELGFTYSHEHIVCRPAYWSERGEDDLLLDDPAKSKQDVLDFKKHGGQVIVDATAVDYGRDVPAVHDIMEQTGVRIIGTAGFNKSFLWDASIKEELKPIIGHTVRTMSGLRAPPLMNWPISSSGKWKKVWKERRFAQVR